MSGVTILPIAGAVTPAPGVGVTLHGRDGKLPGTILRAGPRVFWFRLDAPPLAVERGVWTYRAVLQPDGTWREDHDMQRVDVGIRRFVPYDPARQGTPGQRTPEQLAEAVERIEPWLRKRRWYPMTYMGIPSVLRSADELLVELAAYSGLERERVAALHERLAKLREGFRNLGGGDASAAAKDFDSRGTEGT